MTGQGLHGLRYGDYQVEDLDVHVVCVCVCVCARVTDVVCLVVSVSSEANPCHSFQRYRQYCARKLQRLRKGLNFVHWEQGKGKSKFVQRAITAETVVDERYLSTFRRSGETDDT
jgi:hypothetical protein